MAAPHSPDADGSLTGATRTAVLAALRRAGEPLTVQRIAGELGLHSNTVRFHLARLVRARLVFEEQAERSGPGRPHLLYRAAPSADETSGDGYRFLAEVLAGHLAATSQNPAEDATAAGEEWGRYLAQRPAPFTETTEEQAVEQVTAILSRLQFAPESGPDGRRLLLHNCPFRSLADRRPNVACSVHLGIMRGALATMRAPLGVTELERFDAPHPCIAHLAAEPPTDDGEDTARR